MAAARIRLVALVLLVIGVPALAWLLRNGEGPRGERGGASVGAEGVPTHPETLTALVRNIQAARAQGDRKRLLDLVHAMLPEEADWRAILKAGPETDAFLGARDRRVPSRLDEAGLASLADEIFDPGDAARTEIQEHAATTEALAAAPFPGGLDEFPGGMVRFAQRVAAPARTWYTVELLEPGQDTGMRYACFTRLGDRWLFLPKPWRDLPRDE